VCVRPEGKRPVVRVDYGVFVLTPVSFPLANQPHRLVEVDIKTLRAGDLIRARTATGSVYELSVEDPATSKCGVTIEVAKPGVPHISYKRARVVLSKVAVGHPIEHRDFEAGKSSYSSTISGITISHGRDRV
jgi:hypothetical protein